MEREITRINLEIVLDRSGSVEAEKIPIENGISLLIEAYKRKYNNELELGIEVYIVGEDDIHLPLTGEKNINLKKILCKDKDMISVLSKVSEEFSKERIILFSDGYFNNDSYKEQWKNRKNILKTSELFSIGVGTGYNKESLKFLSGDKVYEIEDIYDLV